jgi:hypothetical protein
MINSNNNQLLGKALYYFTLIIIPLYLLTIGTPHTKKIQNLEGITIIVDEESYGYGYHKAGLTQIGVNTYQVTGQWGTFEIWTMNYYDRAILYSVIFDSLIILSWRLTRT